MSQRPRSVLARYANSADLFQLEYGQRRELADAIKATLRTPQVEFKPWHYLLFGMGGAGFVWMLYHMTAAVI